MFVSGGQFYVFISCVAFGGMSGILFSFSELIKLKINNDLIRIIPDFIAFIITTGLFIIYSHLLSFPNFRLYMILGSLLGIIIYFKSFHILLANCMKKLYNLFIKVGKIFTKRKLAKDGRSEN